MQYLMIFAGAVIALLERYLSAYTRKDFYFAIFLQKNLPLFVFNLVAGFTFVAAIDIANTGFKLIFNGFDYTLITWLCVGTLAHYIWKMLIATFRILFENVIKKFGKPSGNKYNDNM